MGAGLKRIGTSRSAMTRTILRTAREALGAGYDESRGWYRAANDIACDIAAENNLTVSQAAGIISALSPQKQWERNVVLAHEVARNGEAADMPDITGDNRSKALRILAGADPLDVLGGPKTRAFYCNILDPERSDDVTVDRHAITIAVGFDRALTPSGKPVTEWAGVYDAIAASYRAAARILGMLPSEIQAVTWSYHRDQYAWRKPAAVAA